MVITKHNQSYSSSGCKMDSHVLKANIHTLGSKVTCSRSSSYFWSGADWGKDNQNANATRHRQNSCCLAEGRHMMRSDDQIVGTGHTWAVVEGVVSFLERFDSSFSCGQVDHRHSTSLVFSEEQLQQHRGLPLIPGVAGDLGRKQWGLFQPFSAFSVRR